VLESYQTGLDNFCHRRERPTLQLKGAGEQPFTFARPAPPQGAAARSPPMQRCAAREIQTLGQDKAVRSDRYHAWPPLSYGRINMRNIGGWQTFATAPATEYPVMRQNPIRPILTTFRSASRCTAEPEVGVKSTLTAPPN